jgi:starch-binding outer membrane protein SusE/F
MKKRYWFSALVTVLIVFGCEENKENSIISIVAPQQLVSPADSSSIKIDTGNLSKTITFKWTAAKYTTENLVPEYTVQMVKAGDNFDNPFNFYSLADTILTVKYDTINSAALFLGAADTLSFPVKIRIYSAIGNELVQLSDTISLTIEPYLDTIP